MLKRALKISLIISLFFAALLGGAAYLTKSTKDRIKKEETTVPDKVEYTEPEVISAETMYKRVAKKLKVKEPDVFTAKYQKAAYSLVEKYKKATKYTFDAPLLIVNPYGTNTTGLYIYFRHSMRVNTKYMVSVKEIDGDETLNRGSFSAALYTNTTGMTLAEQEGLIIGLIPGEKNYVSVYIYDENDKMIGKAGYKIDVPESESVAVKTLKANHDREVSQLSEGLYAVFGLSGGSRDVGHILFYDNYGMVRAELPMTDGSAAYELSLGFVEDKLFYPISANRFVLVGRLGKIEKFFKLESGASIFGDVAVNSSLRKAVAFAKKDGNDGIYSIDILEGKTKKIVSLDKLFASYYKSGGSKLKFTSVQFINDNDLLVSEKNTSSIIRINNVFRNPSVKAVISGTGELNVSEFKKVFYTKEGDFANQKNQDTAYINKDANLGSRKYQLIVFNNNSRGNNSFVYRYTVDEEKMTYTQDNSVELPYSFESGSASLNNGYLVAAYTGSGSFAEYNPDGFKLADFSFTGGKTAYRVFKYGMKGSWFKK